jgi:tRNA pseudouridine55 synthase
MSMPLCRRDPQLPPMHSAIKHQGQPLYRLARQGIEVERGLRTVCPRARAAGVSGDELTIEVHCSKGTYIRTLAQDIGLALDVGLM